MKNILITFLIPFFTSQFLSAQSKTYFIDKTHHLKVIGIGNDYDLKDTSIDYKNITLIIDFYLNNELIRIMRKNISSLSIENKNTNRKNNIYANFLNEISKSNEFNFYNDFLDANYPLMTFSEVNFSWDDSSNAYQSFGDYKIASIGNKPILLEINGLIEITKLRSGPIFEMYFQIDENNWYYFRYTRCVMQVLSSSEEFNNQFIKLKPKERKLKVSRNEMPFIYMYALTDYKDLFYDRFISLNDQYSKDRNITEPIENNLNNYKEISSEIVNKTVIDNSQNEEKENEYTIQSRIVDIDENIPVSDTTFPNRYALIIGNEDYQSFQTNLSSEANVAFAERDALLFKQYAIKTLGIPEENILFGINVGHIEMERMFSKVNLIIKHSNGIAVVFIYYAGHGFPDIKTKTPYLMPVDVSATDLKYALKLKDAYALLTEYPSKRITFFLDACFSGGGRNLGLFEARAVKVKPKEECIKGNFVVFSASSEEQAALVYKEYQHGIFTYYLLKHMQVTKGETSYLELYEYLSKNVPIKSILINNLEQTPKLNISPSLGEKWKEWTLK